jgi:C1A family cysteine protease
MKLIFALLILSSTAFAESYMGSDGPTFTTDDSLRKAPHALGLIVPQERKSVRSNPMKDLKVDLPAKFSWQDKLTPIKNQGNCGSCWAFSAQATFADVMALHGKGMNDYSEQWMVSCDKESSGCNGGWFHSAFQLAKKEGNVFEKDMPYKASDLKCPSSLPHTTKLIQWQELSTGVASVDDIKKAVFLYGPVSVAVSVTGAFDSYKSGIYNEGTSGSLNHATNIVGWDETVKPAHWIMRNSWGTSWGENGYMRIAYGSRKIGYAATYINIFGPIDQTPTPEPTPEPTPDPTPQPTPTPDPTPCPDCPECEDCPECTFAKWFKNLFN